MDIHAPLDSSKRVDELTITTGNAFAYVTDLIWTYPCRIHALWAVLGPQQGGVKAIESLAGTLRSKNGSADINVLQEQEQSYYNPSLYRYERKYEVVVSHKTAYLDPSRRENFALDRVSIPGAKVWEMCMYDKASSHNDQSNAFTLILPWELPENDKLDLIFDHLNWRCPTIPLAREWTESLWEWLVNTRNATQCNSFGRFVGFNITLNELQIRQFITREMKARRIFFPGMGDEDEDLAA